MRIDIPWFTLLLTVCLILPVSADHYTCAPLPPMGWNSWDTFGTTPAMVGALDAIEVKSPDGNLTLEFPSECRWRASLHVEQEWPAGPGRITLGLVREDADFSRQLTLLSESPEECVQDHYALTGSKRRLHDYRATRRVFSLADAKGRRINIIFQISNDGAAFRYVFPESDATIRAVSEEATSFRFAPDVKAWLQPMAVAKTGFAKTNPSYEEYHEQEIPVGTPSKFGADGFSRRFSARMIRRGFSSRKQISGAVIAPPVCVLNHRVESIGSGFQIGAKPWALNR